MTEIVISLCTISLILALSHIGGEIGRLAGEVRALRKKR